MGVLYTTVKEEALAEQTIEKSRFIAHIKPVLTRQEAEEYIAKISGEYKDATHNVPCFVLGQKMELAWSSEDGEPSGTAGAPMLSMLKNMGLTNVVVVVTRYFGGIKLGPGGLIRAYTGSLRLALEKAGILEVREIVTSKYTIPYFLFDRIKYLAETEKFDILDKTFSNDVDIVISYDKDNADNIEKIFKNLLKKS